jgi:hypothetical protein
MRRTSSFLLSSLILSSIVTSSRAQPAPDLTLGHPRAIILSDIGNEPDDQMSLVRLLLYSNEIDLEGLIATTSTWQKTTERPDLMHAIIDAYGSVLPNLKRNASGWPGVSRLHAIVATGQDGYGMEATTRSSAGASAIIKEADRADRRPLWIALWGGANTLARALIEVREHRTPDEVARFIGKLRVYSISDQDDAGPWIRRNFPSLFYIVQPSNPDAKNYAGTTWTGISGDGFYHNGEGADSSLVTNDWLDRNIRSEGELGQHYPRFKYIMEGDTPSFLGLVDNGLNSFRSPSWGGWGGRYVYRMPQGETHPIWTQGQTDGSRGTTSSDEVLGTDGQIHLSDQATIWRWRSDFQNDFAARMDWTVLPYARANHQPKAVVNGIGGKSPIFISARAGQPLTLDAGASSDPDGQKLQYRWFFYKEAGYLPGQPAADVKLDHSDTQRISVLPTVSCQIPRSSPHPACQAGIAHIILAITDNGKPPLTSYRRIIRSISLN